MFRMIAETVIFLIKNHVDFYKCGDFLCNHLGGKEGK